MSGTKAKNQHYVPQFALRNFCVDDTDRIFVFDKRQDRVFRTNIKNIGSEQGFYDFALYGSPVSIESEIKKLEDAASVVIRKIIRTQSLRDLTDGERLVLSVFIAAQYSRVKEARLRIGDLNRSIAEDLQNRGINLDDIANFRVMTDEEIKKLSILGVFTSQEYVPYIYDKVWILFKTPKRFPLYISDNPVTMQNIVNPGGSGFGVEGVEIYFPINQRLLLGIYCRSHEQKLLEGIANLQRNLAQLGPYAGLALLTRESQRKWRDKLIRGMRTGTVVPLKEDSVVNNNSLQVVQSTRYIFSSYDNFDLVRDIIAEQPSLKESPDRFV